MLLHCESWQLLRVQIINGDIDHDFAILMTGHHHSAVDSSRLEIIYGHEDSMKSMSKNIIESQLTEINEFQDWQIARGNK